MATFVYAYGSLRTSILVKAACSERPFIVLTFAKAILPCSSRFTRAPTWCCEKTFWIIPSNSCRFAHRLTLVENRSSVAISGAPSTLSQNDWNSRSFWIAINILSLSFELYTPYGWTEAWFNPNCGGPTGARRGLVSDNASYIITVQHKAKRGLTSVMLVMG